MSLRAKLVVVALAAVLALAAALVGCSSGVSQEDYDAVVAERDAAQAQVSDLEADVADLQAQVADLEDDAAALQTQIADLEAANEAMATKVLPDVLTMLSVVDEIDAWSADPTNTALLGALTQAIDDTGLDGLIESWDAFLAASATGNPGMTLHQFYGYMLGECSLVASLFPTEVQPLMEVGDEMNAMTAALDLALLGEMSTAVNASGNAELIQRWNEILGTFGTDLPGAMVKMADMQVWMLDQIAAAAPSS